MALTGSQRTTMMSLAVFLLSGAVVLLRFRKAVTQTQV
jgi:LPXTG-motif cell wall-anchored protein